MTVNRTGNKKVLVICKGSLESVATLTRVLDEIKVLQKLEGVQLHVAWLLNRSYRTDPARRQWAESIRQEWSCPHIVLYSLPLLGTGTVGRLASAAVYFISLTAYLLARGIEVVQVHSFSGVQGAMLRVARLLRIRTVLDMQGAHPEEMAYRGASKRIVRYLNHRERQVLRTCDVIFCVSHKMVDHLVQKHGVTGDKFRIVPCCVPSGRVGVNPERRRQVRGRLGLEDKFVLVYSGGTASYQCVPEMCALFAAIAERCPQALLLVFSWGDLDLFRRCLARHNVSENRCLFRTLEQREVHDFLLAADAGFLLREDELLNRVSSPTKFAEYLAAGVPVITTPHAGDAASTVMREDIGTLVDLPPLADIEALMNFLREVRNRRDEIGRKCVNYVEREWVWESHKAEFLDAVGVEDPVGFNRARLPVPLP